MMGELGRIIRDLRGAAGPRFAGLLVGQLDAAIEATEVIGSVIAGERGWSEVGDRVGDLEHEGDRLRAELVRELAVAVVTPLDREDLFRVSRSIDDVLDNLRDLRRECVLFEPARTDHLQPLLEATRVTLVELRGAAEAIGSDPGAVSKGALAARKCGNRIRRLYDERLAIVFREPLDIETLKTRELLRRLDVIGLRLGEAADALADAAIKRDDPFE
jgi:uncharacterized protein